MGKRFFSQLWLRAFLILIIVVVGGAAIVIVETNRREKNQDRFIKQNKEQTCDGCWENFSGYMDHPSKCYSCEREVIKNKGEAWAWIGQKTKSFDAEQAMIMRTGRPDAAYDAHPIRYY